MAVERSMAGALARLFQGASIVILVVIAPCLVQGRDQNPMDS